MLDSNIHKHTRLIETFVLKILPKIFHFRFKILHYLDYFKFLTFFWLHNNNS